MIFVPENATLGEACVLGVGEDGGLKGSRVNQAVNQAEYNSIIVELGGEYHCARFIFQVSDQIWVGGGWMVEG